MNGIISMENILLLRKFKGGDVLDEDLIREANKIVNAKDISEALKDLRELYLDDVALTANAIYDECKKAGFTEQQAFDITKSYVLEFCSLEWVPGEEEYEEYKE